MSGPVVQPGDTLVFPLLPTMHGTTPKQRDLIRDLLQAELPGVKVLVVEGMAGGPFVYRPGAGS